jgi:hypothetical protein
MQAWVGQRSRLAFGTARSNLRGIGWWVDVVVVQPQRVRTSRLRLDKSDLSLTSQASCHLVVGKSVAGTGCTQALEA